MATEYESNLSTIINAGSVAVMMSLAKDTGILSALKESDKPLTTQEVSDLKGLKERYVREILGCLTAAKVVRLGTEDTDKLTYYLTEEEKQSLQGETWAFLSLPMVNAHLYDNTVSICSASGPYGGHYGDKSFQLMGEIQIALKDKYIDTQVNNVPGLKENLERGIDVIEFGCGSGLVISELATRYPNSSFTASDVLPELLDKVKTKYGHLPNLTFEVHNLCHLSGTIQKKYDWVYSIDVIHDLPKPLIAAENVRYVVKEEGIYTLVEPCIGENGSHAETVGNMGVACLYGISTFFCVQESFQEEDSAALGLCHGKNIMSGLLSKAKFKVNHVMMNDAFAVFICKPI